MSSPVQEWMRGEARAGYFDTEALAVAVCRMPAAARDVVVRRFGLDGRAPATLQQLGAVMGLHRESVRRHEAKAVMGLRRRYLEASGRLPSCRPI